MPRYELKGGSQFFEVERDRRVVRTCRGDSSRKRLREKTYDTDDEARFAYGRAIARFAAGLALVGPPRHLPFTPAEPAGSMLLVEEYFAAADDRFGAEIVRVTAGGQLAAFAERWASDARPWARRALLAYIDDGCDRPEHKALVKRLFKRVESAADDEAMAHFLVAFDGIGGRVLVPRYADSVLHTDPLIRCRIGKTPSTRFSRATRTYLARRAYRYFRGVGFRDVARYGRALRIALPLYRDDRLDTPARFLDAWGLLHALYHRSPVLRTGTHAFDLARNTKLADLAPAPHFPAAWLGVFDELYAALLAARSQAVRAWLLAWLRAHYAPQLAALSIAQVIALVTSPHEEVQRIGAELLPKLAGLDALPITTWLELLAIERADIVGAVCEIVPRHVTPARVSLAQCVALACASAAPVARLGLEWARAKKLTTADDLRAVAALGKARVAAVRDEAATWAARAIAAHPSAQPEHLRDLCDAPHADVRGHALATVATTDKLATPALWYALTESPYDDVRAVVVRNAERWKAEAAPATLAHVWSSALLAVHRGSRTKAGVPRAIAERIAAHPGDARALLPLLALALRSVRPPERATALAALARAIHTKPELRELAHELIPELSVGAEVTA